MRDSHAKNQGSVSFTSSNLTLACEVITVAGDNSRQIAAAPSLFDDERHALALRRTETLHHFLPINDEERRELSGIVVEHDCDEDFCFALAVY